MTSHGVTLWGAAVLTYGLGDRVTTVLRIRTAGARKDSPPVRRPSDDDPGPDPFAALKLTSVALFSTAYWALKPVVA